MLFLVYRINDFNRIMFIILDKDLYNTYSKHGIYPKFTNKKRFVQSQ